MGTIFSNIDAGRKNIIFGIALFIILGVVTGLPLTIDLFGGSIMTDSQYQTWKVLHAYGVFVAFVNFFFGYGIDRMNLSRRQKEIASWGLLVAGVVGGIGRPVLSLLAVPAGFAGYTVSLIETVGFVISTFLFLHGQMKVRKA